MHRIHGPTPQPIHATVCFLSQRGKILLQKRPSHLRWAGRLNGPGGKIDSDETPVEAVTREVEEETALRLRSARSHGTLLLYFGNEQLLVHVFSSADFSGRTRGSEGALRWYSSSAPPFDRMWPDQRHWLPLVLAGARIDGTCSYDEAGANLRSCTFKVEM